MRMKTYALVISMFYLGFEHSETPINLVKNIGSCNFRYGLFVPIFWHIWVLSACFLFVPSNASRCCAQKPGSQSEVSGTGPTFPKSGGRGCARSFGPRDHKSPKESFAPSEPPCSSVQPYWELFAMGLVQFCWWLRGVAENWSNRSQASRKASHSITDTA